jgi:hypothetical protein
MSSTNRAGISEFLQDACLFPPAMVYVGSLFPDFSQDGNHFWRKNPKTTIRDALSSRMVLNQRLPGIWTHFINNIFALILYNNISINPDNQLGLAQIFFDQWNLVPACRTATGQISADEPHPMNLSIFFYQRDSQICDAFE